MMVITCGLNLRNAYRHLIRPFALKLRAWNYRHRPHSGPASPKPELVYPVVEFDLVIEP